MVHGITVLLVTFVVTSCGHILCMNSIMYRQQQQLIRSRRLLPTARVVRHPRPESFLTVVSGGRMYPYGDAEWSYVTGEWRKNHLRP